MRRPTVLHVARDWVRPSEGFVTATVAATTRTRPVVVSARRWDDSPAADVSVRTYELGGVAGRVPARWRRRTVRGLLAAIAIGHRVGLLHAHFAYWAPHAEAVARRLDRPWLVSVHGHDVLVQPTHQPEVLAAVRRAPLVVAPSRFLADRLTEAGVLEEAIRVIPSGLDLADLPFRARTAAHDRAATVSFAGRFVEKKGVLDAVAVFSRLARDHDVRFRFVGTGPLEDDLHAALRRNGLAAEVVDGSPPGALREALTETDLLLTPSRPADDGDAETLGLVNLEAQACGVPVVTTRHGGIPEAVSERGAVLVAPGDTDAMAAALAELLTHPERWAEMGGAGREHVLARFDLGDRVAELEAEYLALLDRTRSARATGRAD